MGGIFCCCRTQQKRPPLLLPNDLETGDIVLFKTNSCAACCTRTWTQGPWDHVAIILRTADGLRTVECTGAGVGCYILQERLDDPSVSVAAIRRLQTVTITDARVANLNRFLQAVKDKPYRSAPCLWARQICADCCSCCYNDDDMPPRSPVLSTRRAKYLAAAPSSRALGNVRMHNEDGSQLGFPPPARVLRAAPDSVIVDISSSRRASFSANSSDTISPKNATIVVSSTTSVIAADDQWNVQSDATTTSAVIDAPPNIDATTGNGLANTLEDTKLPTLASPTSSSSSDASAMGAAAAALAEAAVQARTEADISDNRAEIQLGDSRGFFCSSFVAACYMHLGLLPMGDPSKYMPLQFTEPDTLHVANTNTNNHRGVTVTASRATGAAAAAATPSTQVDATSPSTSTASSSTLTMTTSSSSSSSSSSRVVASSHATTVTTITKHKRSVSSQPASTGRLPLLGGAMLSSSVYLAPAPRAVARPQTPSSSIITLPGSPLPPIRSITDTKTKAANNSSTTGSDSSNGNGNDGKKDPKTKQEFDSIPHNA